MDQKKLKSLLRYEPDTGEFYRLTATKSRYGILPVGSRAGSTLANGYRMIGIDKERYLSHRLAWLFVYGEWPLGFIDHIDGDRANNAIANLRCATVAQNGWNTRKSWGRSGIRGVRFNKGEGRWVANINVNGKRRFLGYFDSAEQARTAYEKVAKEEYGDFSPY